MAALHEYSPGYGDAHESAGWKMGWQGPGNDVLTKESVLSSTNSFALSVILSVLRSNTHLC